MEALRFDGQVAVITGAGGTKGREYAAALASRGAAIVLNDIAPTNPAASDTTASLRDVVKSVEEHGGTALAIEGDLRERATIELLVAVTLQRFGRLDILINNAGDPMGPVGTGRLEDFRESAEVHYFATVALTREVWPHFMRAGYGRIVNTTSVAVLGLPGMAPYAAAKGAVLAFARSLAAELELMDIDVRVNCVSPCGPSKGEVAGRRAASQRQWTAATAAKSLDYPAALYLAHSSCQLNGETLTVGEGRMTRLAFAETLGITAQELSPESIADQVDRILDDSSIAVLRNVDEWNVRRRGQRFPSATGKVSLWSP